jgi:hypothetical protein
MDEAIQRAGERGVEEIVIGMAHRGRLNVLVNTLGKMPQDLFAEFEGKHGDDLPAGDVKYHQAFHPIFLRQAGQFICLWHLILHIWKSLILWLKALSKRVWIAAVTKMAHKFFQFWFMAMPLCRAGRCDGNPESGADTWLRYRRYRSYRH